MNRVKPNSPTDDDRELDRLLQTAAALRAAQTRAASLPAHDDIAQRAYLLYLERGRQHGCDLDDWLTAERELVGKPAPF